MHPLMTRTQIRSLEKALLSLGKKHLSILEWGSGGSTLYFTEFLAKHGISYEWVSLEYNKRWFEDVSKAVSHDKGIRIVLFDVGNDKLHQRHTNMDEYVNYPASLGKKFDFVLVDGRKRRRCVLEAKNLLAPNGAVFLHDAHRRHYQCVRKEFRDSAFITPHLWRGKNETPSVAGKFVRILRNSAMRSWYFVLVAPYFFFKNKLKSFLYPKD